MRIFAVPVSKFLALSDTSVHDSGCESRRTSNSGSDESNRRGSDDELESARKWTIKFCCALVLGDCPHYRIQRWIVIIRSASGRSLPMEGDVQSTIDGHGASSSDANAALPDRDVDPDTLAAVTKF
jgi:hypothetical protein